MAEELYSAADVFHLLGVQYRPRKNTKVVCPSCGHTTYYMNMERNVGCCKRASCGFKGNHLTFYAQSMGMSNKDAHADILDRLGKGEVVKTSSMTFEDVPCAPIAQRNAAYGILRDELTLLPYHIKKLLKRGLTASEIESLGYRSYVYKDIKEHGPAYAKKILSAGVQLNGIPGFFQYEDVWTLKYGRSGILIPYLDEEGRIQGFQIRRDNPPKDDKGNTDGKYIWLSSSGKKDGSSSNAFVHWAVGHVLDLSTGKTSPKLGKKVYLTEGAMKGDIIHILTREPVLAVPGVEALTELEKILPRLKDEGVEEICVAYDMDYLTNPNVQTAQEKLKLMLFLNGFTITRKTWDTTTADGKNKLNGLDDFLMYHLRNVNP